eukprot:sb/3467672/
MGYTMNEKPRYLTWKMKGRKFSLARRNWTFVEFFNISTCCVPCITSAVNHRIGFQLTTSFLYSMGILDQGTRRRLCTDFTGTFSFANGPARNCQVLIDRKTSCLQFAVDHFTVYHNLKFYLEAARTADFTAHFSIGEMTAENTGELPIARTVPSGTTIFHFHDHPFFNISTCCVPCITSAINHRIGFQLTASFQYNMGILDQGTRRRLCTDFTGTFSFANGPARNCQYVSPSVYLEAARTADFTAHFSIGEMTAENTGELPIARTVPSGTTIFHFHDHPVLIYFYRTF